MAACSGRLRATARLAGGRRSALVGHPASSAGDGRADVPLKRSGYRHLVILALAGFVTAFGAHIVSTNLPSYAERAHVGAFTIGVLIGIYDFAELFAKPMAGFIADRRGMKSTLLAGLILFIFGSLLFLVIPYGLLLLVRFVQGLGAAALSTVSITLVAKYFTTGRGKAFGIYNTIKGAGYVIAPAVGGFLAQAYGFAMIFSVSAAVGTVVLLLSLLLPADRSMDGELAGDDELAFKELFLLFKDPRWLPVYAVILVNMFLVGILFGFLPVYLHGIGYTALESGAAVSVATLSYLAVQPFAGHLADKLASRITVIGGLALAAIAIIAATYTAGVPLLIVIVLAGIGTGTVWTNSDALVGEMARPSQLGATMGAAQSFKELGDMVGPLAIGLLTQLFGVRIGFVVCGGVALLLLAILATSRSFRLRDSRGGARRP
jgi:MFS family permease